MFVFVLPVLLFSQGILASPTLRETRDLSKILDVGTRYLKLDEGDLIKVCNQDPIELGLVIDSSVSIRYPDFLLGQKFLSDFLDTYDIGPGKKQVRVSAVTFGRGVYTEDSFNLNTYKHKADVLKHVQEMPFRYGTRTDTGDAIAYMRDMQMANTRPWAPKIAIVLTDGNSQRASWTKQQAEEAIAANITMFAVGVGSVSRRELENIAGDPKRVIQADNYGDLEKFKQNLSYKTCFMKPKPTTTPIPTTTTTMAATERCRMLYQSDINFVFSPASLGIESTSWVTQFISHTVSSEYLESGFQYGAMTGRCSDFEGFRLDQYSDADDIREHLSRYDRNNLPGLVSHVAEQGFSPANGARSKAAKIAVLFVGKAKVDPKALAKAIQELQDSGVQVFVSGTDSGARPSLPDGVHMLDSGSSLSQATELVSRICHLDNNVKENQDEGGSEEDC